MTAACLVSQLLAAAALGLLAGALLAEGALLVPYWRSLTAREFYRLHPVYGPMLYAFYAPLTAAVPVLGSVAAAAAHLAGHPGRWLSTAAALLTWSMLAVYLVYFRGVNESFRTREVAPSALAGVLARWAAWHHARSFICVLAFGLALWAMVA